MSTNLNTPILKQTFGITLSGGGAKGIAHIGVLQALLEHGIEPTVVSGTSAGSIVGALYAAGCSVEDMKRFVNDSRFYKIFRLVGIPNGGFVKLTYLKERLAEFIAEDSFESLKYPLFVAATNLNQGRAVLFDKGELFNIVMASCAVPWLFSPVEINGELYADGGMTNNLPAAPVRERCEILIGSNVKPKVVIDSNKQLSSFLGITERVVDLGLWTNAKPHVKMLDVYIAPPKILDFSFFDLKKTEQLTALGYEATMEKIPKIKQLIAAQNVKI
ncbi:MAG: hypothetical protein RL757_53 [Bacteroidota bacterium]|jgi:NTE family protein